MSIMKVTQIRLMGLGNFVAEYPSYVEAQAAAQAMIRLVRTGCKLWGWRSPALGLYCLGNKRPECIYYYDPTKQATSEEVAES